jgi:hypothetical protein
MKEFWRAHKDQLPLPVLFVPGPRLLDKGFSWAPSSFLPCQKAGPAMSERGTVTDDGLFMKLPSYRTFTVNPPSQLTEPIFPLVLDGNKYFIRKSPARSNPSWDGLELHTRDNLAIILEYNTLFPFIHHEATKA